MRSELIAGDTLDFETEVPDYPATDGWTLKYRLVPRTVGGTAIDITAAADGADYRVQVGPLITAGWGEDDYWWTSWVEKTGARYSVASGPVTIKPDPATVAAGFDGRSHARRVLEAIEAVLEKRATLDQEEYTINGRSLKRTPIADLLVLRDKAKAEVFREDAQEALRNGLPDPRQVHVRFSRV